MKTHRHFFATLIVFPVLLANIPHPTPNISLLKVGYNNTPHSENHPDKISKGEKFVFSFYYGVNDRFAKATYHYADGRGISY